MKDAAYPNTAGFDLIEDQIDAVTHVTNANAQMRADGRSLRGFADQQAASSQFHPEGSGTAGIIESDVENDFPQVPLTGGRQDNLHSALLAVSSKAAISASS